MRVGAVDRESEGGGARGVRGKTPYTSESRR